MPAKCPICTTTRGKRDCLLKNGDLICPRCCAQTRSPETCSPCPHFKKAEEEKIKKLINSGTLHSLIEINPEVENSVDQALIQIENSRFSKGEEILFPLLEKHPNDHLVHYGLGCLYAMQEEYPRSVSHFEKSVELFPHFLAGWHNLGMSYRKVVNIKGAVTCAQKVMELGAFNDREVVSSREFVSDFKKMVREQYNFTLEEYFRNQALFDQAFEEMTAGDIPAAIQSFHDVLKDEPTHHQSYGNLGLCYGMLGEKEKALAHLDKALELNPDYEVAALNRPTIEALEPGEKLEKSMRTVNYGATGITPI